MLGRIFQSERDKLVWLWRKLQNEDQHNLYFLPDFIRDIKWRRMRYVGHVQCIWNHLGISVQINDGSCVNHTELTQDKYPMVCFCYDNDECLGSKTTGFFFIRWITVNCWKLTLYHVFSQFLRAHVVPWKQVRYVIRKWSLKHKMDFGENNVKWFDLCHTIY